LLLARGYQALSYVCCGRSLLSITFITLQCATISVVGGEWFAIVTLEGCHARTTDGTNLGAVDYAICRTGRRGKDVTEARVTFIAGPPREFLRVLSQQGSANQRTRQRTNSRPQMLRHRGGDRLVVFGLRIISVAIVYASYGLAMSRAADTADDIATDGTTHLGPDIGGHRCRFYASEAGTTRTSWCRKRDRDSDVTS
jgi:hypothetical protein